MRKFVSLSVLISVVFLVVTNGFAYFIRYDGPYEGRIIDSETKQPIEGVVVLGVWYKEVPNVAGSSSTFYEAKETITDKNGDFKIPGLGLKMFSYVGMMRFMIFKAGYMHLYGPWESLKESDYYRKMVQWEGEKVIVPLRKLTMAERIKELGPPSPPDEAPKEKIKLMLQEINKDRREQGLGPIDVGR